jgi:hypothetical protein
VLFSPRGAKVVGTIRAPQPPGDGTANFKQIDLDAYRIACSDVGSVESEIRTQGHRRYVVVRCDSERPRAVRLIYTGVTVPNLVGRYEYSLDELGSMLGLNIQSSSRPRRPGEKRYMVVAQNPPGGSVVPFGTTLEVVFAK